MAPRSTQHFSGLGHRGLRNFCPKLLRPGLGAYGPAVGSAAQLQQSSITRVSITGRTWLTQRSALAPGEMFWIGGNWQFSGLPFISQRGKMALCMLFIPGYIYPFPISSSLLTVCLEPVPSKAHFSVQLCKFLFIPT